MTTKDTKAPRKRRFISKANLLRELNAVTTGYGLNSSSTVGDLENAIKASIVDEAMSK